MATRQKRIGFIGTGAMGLPMMTNLVQAGYRVRAFDADGVRLAAAECAGAERGADVGDVAASSEVVFLSLPDSRAVEEVVLGPGGIAEALDETLGFTLIDTTSSKAATSERVGAALEAKGAKFLEAPVSGGVGGARKGTLAVMVGGDEAVLAENREVLGAVGKSVIRAGALGAANIVKALNNLLSATSQLAVAEAALLAARAGLDLETFARVAEATLGSSDALRRKLVGNMLAREGTSAFRLTLLYKDLAYATELAAKVKVPDLIAGLAREVTADAHQRFGADAVALNIIRALEAWASDEPRVFPEL